MLVEMPPLRTLLQAAHGAERTRERLFPSQSCLVARVPSLVLGPGPPVPTRDRVPWLSEVWGGGVRTLHLHSRSSAFCSQANSWWEAAVIRTFGINLGSAGTASAL